MGEKDEEESQKETWSSPKMRGGRGGGEKEMQDSENKTTRGEKRAVKMKKGEERNVLSPGCQAEHNTVLLAV